MSYFLCMLWNKVKVLFSIWIYSLFQWNRLSFPHSIILAFLSKINWSYMCGYISGLSTPSHWFTRPIVSRSPHCSLFSSILSPSPWIQAMSAAPNSDLCFLSSEGLPCSVWVLYHDAKETVPRYNMPKVKGQMALTPWASLSSRITISYCLLLNAWRQLPHIFCLVLFLFTAGRLV